MHAFFKASAIAAAAASLATAMPATAAIAAYNPAASFTAPGEQVSDYGRQRYSNEDRRRGYGNYDRYDRRDDRRDYRNNARSWRGNDGRYYCRKSNGTTGLLIGGAAGALLGRGIDTRGDRATGTLLGAAAGALLGREVDRGGSNNCR
ncbi:glycine zipper 2TM domain-containing protein [Novosphingobium sp. AP12]|uniref:glycine zipper 2TM domain-containing protein n=1 Tax=Novosphingobium sp. AP12 TaxID=1144305 RepID=UPI000272008B|nr:glycine zipper 2TM domain-containing protein [Novosphingobium sp. AP12]EJL24135.1 surface antigen family protein [Novosphingobium sp. AP12]